MASEQYKQNQSSAEPINLLPINTLNLLNLNAIPPKNHSEDEQAFEPFTFAHINPLIGSKQPTKEDHIQTIKIEEESNEEDDQDDPQDADAQNSQEVKLPRKKKKCRERKYILDNVEVNKLKNFYKTFMNRISPILKDIYINDANMAQLIDEICQQSNQRSFLDLFPHLKPCHEQDCSSSYFTYTNGGQLKLLRKAAFRLFGLKFNQMVRIIKSSKSFKQTEEFIYGCLFFAQSSERCHKKKNFPPDILEIVSTQYPFDNFEFHEPSIISEQEASVNEQQTQRHEGKQQNETKQKYQQGQKELEKKIKQSKKEGQEIDKSGCKGDQNNDNTTSKDQKESHGLGYEHDSIEQEDIDDGSIHFFQGLTIKSNGAILFQNTTAAITSTATRVQQQQTQQSQQPLSSANMPQLIDNPNPIQEQQSLPSVNLSSRQPSGFQIQNTSQPSKIPQQSNSFANQFQ